MPATVTIADLAKEAYDAFTTTRRPDERDIDTLRDDAPGWVVDLVRAAHWDLPPDDWRYASIRSALGSIANDLNPGDDPDDALDELSGQWADSNVDIYNADRLRWLASNLTRIGWVDEAYSELGNAAMDTMERIGLGQYAESCEVFALVCDGLWRRRDELADDA